MEAAICPRVRVWMAAFGCAVAVLLLIATAAKAGIVTDGVPTDGGCPAIADKPDAAPHVDYQGVKHITYCYGPITISPARTSSGSDRRTMASAVRTSGPRCPATSPASTPSSSTPTEPFPGSTSCTCTTPSGRSTAPRSSPSGRRRRSSSSPRGSAGRAIPPTPGSSTTCCTTSSPSRPRSTSSGGSTSSPTAHLPPASIKPVHTKWLDVAGNPSIYPVFDALRADGQNGTYTFPDQAPAVGPPSVRRRGR